MADLHSKILDARPPLGVQILSISCSFWENLAKSYVGAPLESWRPLLGEILDPPLTRMHFLIADIRSSLLHMLFGYETPTWTEGWPDMTESNTFPQLCWRDVKTACENISRQRRKKTWSNTRMHSARWPYPVVSDLGVCPTPLDADPPPLMQTSPTGGKPPPPGYRPPGCRPLGSPPPGCRPPWMQISIRQIPLGSPFPLWTKGMTHACENITIPQLLLRAVTRYFSAPEQIRNVLNSFTTNTKPEYTPLRRAAFARSALNFISTVH